MSNFDNAFANYLAGVPAGHTQPTIGPAVGTILEVGASTAKFALANAVHGPHPYSRTDDPPAVGDECLVVFLEGGISRAWIVGWRTAD